MDSSGGMVSAAGAAPKTGEGFRWICSGRFARFGLSRPGQKKGHSYTVLFSQKWEKWEKLFFNHQKTLYLSYTYYVFTVFPGFWPFSPYYSMFYRRLGVFLFSRDFSGLGALVFSFAAMGWCAGRSL
jgi:hypothetical protein